MTTIANIYAIDPIGPFTRRLVQEYYSPLRLSCLAARRQAEKVMTLELQQATSEYATMCTGVLSVIEDYVNVRLDSMVPYLLELSEKVESSHNCSTCAGGCKMNHEFRIQELRAAGDTMRKVSGKLQMTTLPLYSDTNFPAEYRLLRNHMAQIETSLSELLYLEQNYLVPKIVEAQNDINASDK